MILKGVDKKEKTKQLIFQNYRDCVLKGIDDHVVKYIQHIGVFEHNRQLVTTKENKNTFSFFNPKVDIPDNYDPYQGDFQTLSLGHFRCGKMYSLEEARNKIKEARGKNN